METVKQELHDKPFGMMNVHRKWCNRQKMQGFCFKLSGMLDSEVKRSWEECPHRQMCFNAFINSDASIYKEKK